ncbi:hypothetical protein [Methanoregula sp.]|uniref:hypothetical protein n=1 Tax=Methanoregula sp. TaxID=2052170 RepID=UPI003BB1CD35
MPDYSLVFLLLNVALGFYNAGTIWAMEIDIFRTWKLVGPKEFHNIQVTHWKKLPYWIFTPVALTLTGGIILVFFHPAGSPAWAIFGNITAQLLSLLLTVIFWGRWQAALSRDEAGPASEYLDKILRTHWIRTFLINIYAVILLAWAIIIVV